MLSLRIDRTEREITMDVRILSSTSKGKPRNAIRDLSLVAGAPGVYDKRFLFLVASNAGSSDGFSVLLDLEVLAAVLIGFA